MTGIHVHMLSFITTLYLLFLFVITFLIMDCNVQYTSQLSKPWKTNFAYFTKLNCKITANNSVIHAFATFIFLSMAGIIYETVTIIAGTEIYYVNGSVAATVLYYDPTIIKYDDVHLLYMISGFVLLFLLVLCPSLLLCIYPTRIYERLSRHVSPRKRLVVKIFAETFQSCFKDGLDGTFDYRIIPGSMILISILCAIVLPLPSNSIVFSMSELCKSLIMNMSLSFHTTLMGLLGILLGLWEQNFLVNTEAVAIGFAILPLIAHTVIMMWAGYNIIISVQSRELCNVHIFKRIILTLMAFVKGSNEYEEIGAGGNNNSQQLQIP